MKIADTQCQLNLPCLDEGMCSRKIEFSLWFERMDMVLILAVLINKAIDSQRWSSLNKVEMPEIPWYDIEERIQTLRWRHAKMYLLSVSCHPPPTTTMSPNKSQKAFPLPKVCVLLGWDQYHLKNEEMVNMWVNIQKSSPFLYTQCLRVKVSPEKKN